MASTFRRETRHHETLNMLESNIVEDWKRKKDGIWKVCGCLHWFRVR